MSKPNMMKQVQEMQARMAKLQDELGQMSSVGTAGGGAVSVTANGHQQVLAVSIEPDALAEGAELLADMVLAACNDALDKSREQAAAQMGQLTAGMGLPPGLL